MHKEIKRASHINIISNILILIVVSITGFLFSSLSLISKAVESFHDILTAIVIHFTIKINNKEADNDHQFGHTRAENIAGYTIGILMIILALTILKESFFTFFNHSEALVYSNILIYTTLFALFVKLSLYFYIKHVLKSHNSPALDANKEDHLNDVFMFIAILIGFIGANFGYFFLDSLVGFIIGIIIFKSGFDICRENIDFLMGKVAQDSFIKKVKKLVNSNKSVLEVNEIKTQYLGSKIQVEIHIALDSKLTLIRSHDIAHEIQDIIEELDEVEHCFVHIEVFKNGN